MRDMQNWFSMNNAYLNLFKLILNWLKIVVKLDSYLNIKVHCVLATNDG